MEVEPGVWKNESGLYYEDFSKAQDALMFLMRHFNNVFKLANVDFLELTPQIADSKEEQSDS